MKYYRVTITRVYEAIHEAPSEENAVDAAFMVGESTETTGHDVEEVSETVAKEEGFEVWDASGGER